MATIEIERAHGRDLEGGRRAAQYIADRLEERASIRHSWDGDVLRLHRRGASGSITVTATTLSVRLELGALLRPMRGRIERRAHEYLDEALST